MLDRFFKIKLWWLFLVGGGIVLNYIALYVHKRFDLTEEKRFTLSAPTKKILSQIDDKITVHIFLEGQLPKEFKKLSFAVEDVLKEFNYYTKTKIIYYTQSPFVGTDSAVRVLLDSAYQLGLRPTNVSKKMKNTQGRQKQIVLPGAIMTYKNRVIGVNFLSESLVNSIHSLSRAEAFLEYKFIYAIEKLLTPVPPLIAYATGHGEPLGYSVYDMFRILARNYRVDTINIATTAFIPSSVKTLLIVKPAKSFSDLDKIKIDQFIMQGGRVFFALDNVRAELDFLRGQKQFVAQNLDLRLEDLLFQYGVRTNYNLLLDKNSDKLPFQVGWNGERPQFELLPWFYAPALQPNETHPITKNIDNVRAQFAGSWDTTQNKLMRKTPLLTTSNMSKKIGTPGMVSWEILEHMPSNPDFFNHPFNMVGVLLEGPPESYIKGRLSADIKKMFPDTFMFLERAKSTAKIVALSDADIVLNEVSPTQGPFEMGMNPYTKYKFGNAIFFENAIEYLTSDNALMLTRNKEFIPRILDEKRVAKEASFWQFVNIVFPVLTIGLFFIIYNLIRYRRYKYG